LSYAPSSITSEPGPGSERKNIKRAYVLPWHARVFQYGNIFVYIVTDVVIIRDALVVEILAWENSA
jgi:hypothetical protein